MKWIVVLLVFLGMSGASPVLADEPKETLPAPAGAAEDEILKTILDITSEIDRANVRLEGLENKFTTLKGEVVQLQDAGTKTVAELEVIKTNQQQQIAAIQQLQSSLAGANARADGLLAQAQNLTGQLAGAQQQAAQANSAAAQAQQQAAWAQQQAAQAARQAQIANNAAAPKGPIGKILGAVFPRMLGHRN